MNNTISTVISNKNFWLNINKPKGYSSAQIVAIVKKLTGAKKVGHAGTLDPLASGVLPVAVNKATKTCQYITNIDKEYYFQITWGEFRDTDDLEGKVIKTNNKRPKTSEVIAALPHFIGKIKQIPPQFSAVKINGKKAYELARNNQYVELKSREIEIYDIVLISNNKTNAQFKINCSKGTYIRSFARDLATKVGVYGYISTLKRLKVGDFIIKNTISLDKLKNIVNYDLIGGFCLDLRDVLAFMFEVKLSNFDVLKVRNGQIVKFNRSFLQSHNKLPANNKSQLSLVKIIHNDQVIGLGKLEQDSLRPINIFTN